MYNFLNNLLNRPIHRNNLRTNNRRRTNVYPGSNLLHNLYNPQINILRNENSNENNNENNINMNNSNTPIFQTSIDTNINTNTNNQFYYGIEDTIENITLPNTSINYYDLSINNVNSSINYIAQILPGINDNTTYYLNFPNEETMERNDSYLFYTIFESGEYRIQYHHDNVLSIEESNILYNNILNNIYNDNIYNNNLEEILNQTFDNNTQTDVNSEKKINEMKENIKIEKYNLKNEKIKNNLCPIDYELLEEEEEICVFNNCNHCIRINHIENYFKYFSKCPLCNTQIKKIKIL